MIKVDFYLLLIILVAWLFFSLLGAIVDRIKKSGELVDTSTSRRRTSPTSSGSEDNVSQRTQSKARTGRFSTVRQQSEQRKDDKPDAQDQGENLGASRKDDDRREMKTSKQPNRHPLEEALSEEGQLGSDEVVLGVIMSEVLRPPKSRRR